jgi:hypothetical protein
MSYIKAYAFNKTEEINVFEPIGQVEVEQEEDNIVIFTKVIASLNH